MDEASREERNGKRRRARQFDKIANAIQACVLALEPLEPAARARVVRAAATLLDVSVAVPGEPFGG